MPGAEFANKGDSRRLYSSYRAGSRDRGGSGAGQWGSSLALAGAFFGLEIVVYMVRVSFQQKPYRRAFMETFGAQCIASPSETTQSGRAILAEQPL